MIAFDSFDTFQLNNQIFRHLDKESLRASKWMAEAWGEPEWCRGFGVHNTHRLAVAPNTSSALLCGGVSQGIEPVVQNVYNQPTAAGEIERINPVLLEIMKKKGKHTKGVKKDIINNNGSVQHVDWLTDDEKEVFKTAFEIDQGAILRLASQRQAHIDQAQSINLFFDADEDEEYISRIHRMAFKDEKIKSLYYMRSMAGIQAAKDSCAACEG
jgi:ribonucleoside-diphosphate reductase alpha chain